jgi:hypothetical protein
LITTGTYDENTVEPNEVDTEAVGSLTIATVKADLLTAFSEDRGGVWDFDTEVIGEWEALTAVTAVDLTYGTSQSRTLALSASADMTPVFTVPPISGEGLLSLNPSAVFTPDKDLLLVAFTQLENQDFRSARLIVTFEDTTTASTTATFTDTGEDFLHALAGTLDNPIVSFEIEGNSFPRIDDLAFITTESPPAAVVPEPSSIWVTLLAIAVSLFGIRAFRCRAA